MKHTSTKPKGATTYKQTAFGIIPRDELILHEIEGTRRGLEFVATNYYEELTPQLIIELHKISFGWIFPDWAGKYRTIPVEYSGKEAPLPHLVPQLMLGLCEDLKERIKHLDFSRVGNIIELLAWFQHRFVVIHPFQDFNGRLARMLTSFILLKLELPPIEIAANTKTDRDHYLEAMYKADEGDLTKLQKLIETALDESLSLP